jgi:hypothetical protein
MVKIIIALALSLVTGCAALPRVETKVVQVPVLFCPAPPDNPRPRIWTDLIGQDEDIGNAVVKYKATIRALLDYSSRQEEIIKMYRDLNTMSKEPGTLKHEK